MSETEERRDAEAGGQAVESPPAVSYQVLLRPYTDIRNPAPGLVAALAEQFDRAVQQADGALCVSVPSAVLEDDTREAVETVLHAAAAHREADTRGWVRVEVTGIRYTGDGYCHVLARCETQPVAAV